MIQLLALAVAVLGLLAWRFPQRRGTIAAVFVALVVGSWAWFEFGAETPPPPPAAPAPALLELEGLVLEPWFGEHRLTGVAHNRSDTEVATGFTASLVLRDCTAEGCNELGEHRQRFNLRIPAASSARFERRVRLLPGTAFEVTGTLEFDLRVEETHWRDDIRRR